MKQLQIVQFVASVNWICNSNWDMNTVSNIMLYNFTYVMLYKWMLYKWKHAVSFKASLLSLEMIYVLFMLLDAHFESAFELLLFYYWSIFEYIKLL